jgi:tRNA pseudouridine38-40 synthase
MTLFDPEEAPSPPTPSPPAAEVGSPAPPGGVGSAGTTRVRLTVAYDGTGFRGFAAQPGAVRTVASVLGEGVARVLGHPARFVCGGRTDAGVHAWGQVVHFESPLPAGALDLAALQRSLNKLLQPAVVVRAAEVAPEGFDARRSALVRRYRYSILNRELPDPFLASTSWHVEPPLDLQAMRAGADPLIGEHDFSSFCRRPPGAAVTDALVRRVNDTRWVTLGGGLLRFEIEASSFCQQMVRSLVGTLVEVGLGRKRVGDMMWILRSRDRAAAGPPAPPHGLCLWEIVYES